MRLVRALKTLLIFGFAVHLHHRFHGPPLDYAGIAAASAASWAGLPGPGEPVLIAGGVFAARHQLDIASVLAAAFAGAAAGGVAGWLIGLKLGRTVMTARGPLLRLRRAAIAQGDELFARYTVLAILLTPAWIAGIHGVGKRIYLLTNTVGAVVWTVGIGLAAYYVGPAAIEFVGDFGTVTGIGLVVLVAVGIIGAIVRRRRRRAAAGTS